MVQKLTIKAANKAPRVINAVTGAAQTLSTSDTNVVIYAASTLSTQSINLPDASGLVIGKEMAIGFAVAISTITWSAGVGNSFLVPPPSSAAMNTRLRFIIDSNNRWCLC